MAKRPEVPENDGPQRLSLVMCIAPGEPGDGNERKHERLAPLPGRQGLWDLTRSWRGPTMRLCRRFWAGVRPLCPARIEARYDLTVGTGGSRSAVAGHRYQCREYE